MCPAHASGDSPELRICLLGPFDVQVGGQPIAGLRSRKEEWLLALLVLRAGKEVSRDWLAGTLWPDSDPQQSLAYLRQSLYNLKKSLASESHRIQSPNSRSLNISLGGAFVDVVAFDDAMMRADTVALEPALGLYRGPLLEGCDEEWVFGERQSRDQAYVRALEQLGQHRIDSQKPEDATRFLRLLVQKEPLRESGWRTLFRAMADSGNYAEMTLAYREMRIVLQREVNAAPSAETSALYEQLRSDGRRRIERAAGASIVERGSDNISAPLNRSDCRDDTSSADLSKPETVPTRLLRIPNPLTRLIGRREVVREALGCLERSRLVSLTGTGGVGKSRIAIQIAHKLAEAKDQDIWFVELASLSQNGDVAQAVARALDLHGVGDTPLENLLSSYLVPRKALLILDNCEHVLDSAATLIIRLLSDCGQLRVLTTSRQPFGILGEVAYPVPAMETPVALKQDRSDGVGKELVAHSMDHESVELFVERAQGVSTNFRLTIHNAIPVAAICRCLDGIPLAIELAAARVRTLSPEQILDRLSDRFGLLSGGVRAVMAHHQTLSMLIDWSYELLTDDEKILFRRLSVFSGGWTLEMAEIVCGNVGPSALKSATDALATPLLVQETLQSSDASNPVFTLLSALADKSLVHAEPLGDELRYHMLETIRQYASEKLDTINERAAIAERHSTSLIELSRNLTKGLNGESNIESLQRFDLEHDNLLSALEWCCGVGDRPDLAMHLCRVMYNFWLYSGLYREGSEWCQRALARPEGVDKSVWAGALGTAGSLANMEGNVQQAHRYHEHTLEIRREIGDPAPIARALDRLALVSMRMGNHEEARRLLTEAAGLARSAGVLHSITSVLINLGCAENALGDFEGSRKSWEEAHALAKSAGNRTHVALALTNLANLAQVSGDLSKARALHEESLELLQESGDKGAITIARHDLGTVMHLQGEFAEARRTVKEALLDWKEFGGKESMIMAIETLACFAIPESKTPGLENHSKLKHSVTMLRAAECAREALGCPAPPPNRIAHEEAYQSARELLGHDAYQIAWNRGTSLSFDDAVAASLEQALSL